MFFPNLKHLSENDRSIRKYDIDLFDWWLGTRSRVTWNYLNPLQFSIDCNIRESVALNLFAEGTINEKIQLFEMRSIIRCQNCSTVIAKAYNSSTPKISYSHCPNCEDEIYLGEIKDEVEIYFALKQEPLPPDQSPSVRIGAKKEKASALNLQRAKEFSTEGDSLSKLFEI